MKKKVILIAAIFTFVFVLCMAVSATEYTVTTEEEYNDAFASAIDGDTIVIKSDIKTNFDFGKSITYILDGGVTWEINGGYVNGIDFNSAEGKIVTMLSKNGNNVIYPNAGMWCNEGKYTCTFANTVWNLGSLDNGTLIFDLNSITGRLFYGSTTKFKEINFLNGVAVKGANKTAVDGILFGAGTINFYEGAEFYGNHSANVMLEAGIFNMYGGKIYGNSCAYGNGFLRTKTLNMYGGEIFMNFLTSKYNNKYGLIGVSQALNIYAGSIHNNVGRSIEKYAAVISTDEGHNKPLYIWGEGAIHDNYSTTTIVLARNSEGYFVEHDEAMGIWGSYDSVNKKYRGIQEKAANSIQYLSVDPSSSGEGFKVTVFDYSVIFMEANSNLISAYMIKDENIIKATVADATEIVIPDGQWTNKFNYCEIVTPVTNAQGTYYMAVNHDCDEDDGDCTTPLICNTCGKVFEADINLHKLQTEVKYENGYAKEGYKRNVCIMCNSFVANEEKLAPIFTCLGYSVGPDGYSLKAGFKIDVNAMNEFKKFHPDFSFGVVMANANTVALTDNFFVDGSLNSSAKGITISINSVKYATLNADISGFTASNAGSLELVVGIYANDGEGNINLAQYVDAKNYTTTKSYKDMSLNAISFNQVRVAHDMEALVPTPAQTGDDE